MIRHSSGKGFTLTEILASFSIMLTVWVCVFGVSVANRKIISYSKHKIQAIYLAQQKIEQLRVSPFPPASITAPGEVIILDDMGTTSTADDLMGHRLVTVTVLDAYCRRVQIEVNWSELSMGGVGIARREYCTTTIANEPTMN